MTLQPPDLCAVRLARGSPLLFVVAPDDRLKAGNLVVIEEAEHEQLATVVISTDQLLPSTVGPNVTGRVLRIAAEADVRELGRRMAQATGLMQMAARHVATLGAAQVIDAYRAPDRSALFVVLDSAPEDAEGLAQELTPAVGLPVVLLSQEPEHGPQPLTGPFAAGVGRDWTNWLVEPGGEPGRLESVAAGFGDGVGEILRQAFPPAFDATAGSNDRRRERSDR